MKRIGLLLFFSIISLSEGVAQDCNLCGTWEGVYKILVPDPNPEGDVLEESQKMVLRIKIYGDDATIRVKSIPIKDPSNVKYWSDCIVSYYDGNTIKWSSYNSTSYDWNNSDRKNGKIIYCAEYTWIGSATFSNGCLRFSYYMHSSYKDKNGNEIGTHDTPTKHLTMYKDEGDW